MRRIFVTGAAGFIGSNLVDRLLEENYTVVGWDNLSTGQLKFLEHAQKNPNFRFIMGDNLELDELTFAMQDCDCVFHIAANADVRFGLANPVKDLEQNTIATSNVLEAMRINGIKRIIFSSTGSVYGESNVFPTPENAPFPIQTSLYAASKVACEGLITSYCEGYQFEGYIFRFVSILGERYSHGHLFDFYKQLEEHPTKLHVLGNGTQKKSYLYIQDCIDAMLFVLYKYEGIQTKHNVRIFNLGTDEYIDVNTSIKILCNELNLSPDIIYSGGSKGWIGDNPFIYLDTTEIKKIGWSPQATIKQSVSNTVKWLSHNKWIYENRK
jgi:UDP-glucose 4-epimerase